jgi:hypothetical protein
MVWPFTSLFRRTAKGARRQSGTDLARRNRVRPSIETLETRATPAVFTVNTLADPAGADPAGMTSLRGAITAGNAGMDPDVTINFQQGLSGTITIGATNRNPLPTLAKNFTINGPGQGALTIARSTDVLAPSIRIFTVGGSTTCSINWITLTNGDIANDNGGAILNGGSLALTGVSLVNNEAGEGGAIYNAANASLNLWSASLSFNTSLGDGGAIYNTGQAWIGSYVLGTALWGNTAAGNGGGIYNAEGASLSLAGTVGIGGNTAVFTGGGIANLGNLTAGSGTWLQGNQTTFAGSKGGGLYNEGTATLTDVTIKQNNPRSIGGGVYVQGGTVTLDGGVLQDNTTNSGNGTGASWNRTLGTLNLINNCQVINNTVEVDPAT